MFESIRKRVRTGKVTIDLPAGDLPAPFRGMPEIGEAFRTGGAAATTLDGYQMAKQGRGQQALVLCFTASVIGGLVTSLATLALLPWLAQIGYVMRSVEMVVVMLFGLTLIAVVAAEDALKGLIAGMFGLLIGAIGTDHIYSTPRATFGFVELLDGVPLVPALVGLFAISEALVMIESETIARKQEGPRESNWAATVEGLRLALKGWWQIVWTGFVGLVIGVIPGAGASIASFVAYQQSRMFSKTPELYGTGHPEGVLAPEAANNGVTSGTLVPLMAIGVPGGSTAAVMMIVLQYHGVVLGPRLFVENPALAYGVFVAMVIAYVFMLFTILPLARYMARVTIVPTRILVPVIVACTIVGAFADRQYVFDMGLALAFGVLGYIARKKVLGVSRLARIVDRARKVEESLRQALTGSAEESRSQLQVAARRARLINVSITLSTIAALLVALVVALLFASTFVPINLAGSVALLFVLAMVALVGALLSFLLEVRVAIEALRIGVP